MFGFFPLQCTCPIVTLSATLKMLGKVENTYIEEDNLALLLLAIRPGNTSNFAADLWSNFKPMSGGTATLRTGLCLAQSCFWQATLGT
jgi:hypothetical protein